MAANYGDDNDLIPPPRPAVGEFSRRSAARWQRRVWSRRVRSWDQHSSPSLASVTAALLNVAAVRPGDAVLDLGCGTGQITIPLAQRGAAILGVDVSPAMADQLRTEAARLELPNLKTATVPIEQLVLQPESYDLIVSSYALHHLRDPDKARLVQDAYRWLRPGGRLVIADMMLGRGGSARDREIIRAKLLTFARKGPAGWWRIAKNVARYLLRVQERPISMSAWTGLLNTAGFTSVAASPVVAEAGLVTGERPEAQARATDQGAAVPRAGRR